MVVDGSGTQNTEVIAEGVTIQRIKEIVGNHSDADIYATLKETNNDPSETIQKLLYQDSFHEVRRKRDKKKEPAGYNSPAETRKIPEKVSPEMRKIPEKVSPKMRKIPEKVSPERRKIPEKVSPEMRKIPENVSQGTNSNTFSDRNNRRGGGFIRNSFTGRNREFRVVRDNRVNQAANKEIMPPLQQAASFSGEHSTSSVADNSISTGTAQNQKSGAGRHSFNVQNGSVNSHLRHRGDGASASATDAKVLLDERRSIAQNSYSRSQTGKPNSRPSSAARNSSNSVLGVYSSSSDPVHVPSSLRPSADVGAFRRDVGVVGGRRQSSDNSGKYHPMHSSHTFSGKDNNTPAESFRQFNTFSRSHQPGQNNLPDSVPGTDTKSFTSNQHGNRSHQQPVGHHHKGTQPIKEWKPKSSQKSGPLNPSVIGAFARPVSLSTENSDDNSQNVKVEDITIEENHLPINSDENQSVLIAEHIRVAEGDHCRLTFGSFGIDANSSNTHATVEPGVAAPPNLLVPAMESSGDGTGHNSPESSTADIASEHQLSEKQPSSSPQDRDNYEEIIRVNNNSSSDTPSESQQQDPSELANFSAYDLQTGYDIPYFRPSIDENVRGLGLPPSQEVLLSPPANIPASSMTMLQQQQQSVAQMYPQVHVSHYANLMPYRQFLSPVYVPPMGMPGYSSNPGYSHPSNANSFVLMPGGGSHLNMNGLKYGVQQFKPVPSGNPTGFGNFASPTGYALNGPGVVGGATGLDESSRLKYKDGNLYVPNPQAESSEMWIQNPRELQGLQSPPFYNMPGQAPHAAAYMPSHTGHHANYTAAAVAQSSHMQFPGLYHPSPQPTALGNPHHMPPTMGGNVGVGVAPAAPGAQVGAYQQPQLGHLNWTTNF